MDREFWIRFGLILFGVFLILFGILGIYNDFKPYVDLLVLGEALPEDLSVSDSTFDFVLIVIGFIFYSIGRHWRKCLKSFTRFCVSIATFLLVLFFILYPINQSSGDLANSVQPSLDFVIAASIDSVIENNLDINYGESLNLELARDVEVDTFYANDLASFQIDFMAEAFGYESKSFDDRKLLSQVLISLIYEQVSESDPSLLDTPIFLSTIRGQLEETGISIDFVSALDPAIIESFYGINDEAYIRVIMSEDVEVKRVVIGDISDSDADLIWNNLGFSDDVSVSSKRMIIDASLSYLLSELENLPVEVSAIPIASMASHIPNDLKVIFSYDFFDSNISNRAVVISKARDDCKLNVINVSEFCGVFLLTEYDTFMSSFDNLSEMAEMDLSDEISDIFEEVSSIEKLESFISDKTSSYKTFLFWTVVLFLVSILFYYLHFKFFEDEMIIWHIPYFVAKINVISLISAYVLVLIIYFFVASGKLLDIFLNMDLDEVARTILEFMPQVPIYNVMLEVLFGIVMIFTWYLLFSLIVLVVCYFLLKRELDG